MIRRSFSECATREEFDALFYRTFPMCRPENKGQLKKRLEVSTPLDIYGKFANDRRRYGKQDPRYDWDESTAHIASCYTRLDRR